MVLKSKAFRVEGLEIQGLFGLVALEANGLRNVGVYQLTLDEVYLLRVVSTWAIRVLLSISRFL